jgi:outer membrane autotransporter protein
MKKNFISHFAGSIRRRCLAGSIAALVAGAVLSLPAPVHAEEEEGTFFWLGETSNTWTGNNWAFNQAGNPTESTPFAESPVTFSANGAQNQTTTLGANFTINSLTINDPTPVTIGGSNTLTIIGFDALTGITVNSGAGLVTISSSLNLSQNSELITVNNTAGIVISGSVSGTGGLVLQGSGTLTLTAANTYVGNTGISGGVLQITNDNNLGNASNAVYLENGGTLRILANVTTNRSLVLDPITITEIFGEDNPPVTISGRSGGSIDTNGYSLTWNGVISGSGSLNKVGTGALTLTGIDTYTGSTTVSQGSLIVDGSIASSTVTVTPGALLGGTGVIGGSVVNGGTVAPGDAPGKLTIAGNYTQSPTGTLLIRIGGPATGQHDLLAVGGLATLGGALQIQQINNFRLTPGQAITFLTAGGGINGQFSSISDPFTSPLFSVGLVSAPGSLSVEATQLPLTSIPGETPNELAVARALDHVLFDPRFANIIGRLDNEPLDKVLSDLNGFGPELLTSIFQIAVSQAQVQTFNLERRLEDVRWGSNGFSASGFGINGGTPGPVGDGGLLEGPDGKSGKSVFAPAPDNRFGVFITGVGEFTSLGDTSNARGYDLTSAGFTLGVDYRVTDHLVIGLATGYDHSDVDPNGGGRVTVDGGKLALYGTAFTGKGFYTNFAVQGGYNSYDSSRPAVQGFARTTTDGGELDVLFSSGYEWKVGGLTFGPTAAFEYTYVGLSGAAERGSLAPLDFSNQSQDSVRSTFGAKASYDWKLGSVTVVPELRLGWQHEYGDNTFEFQSQFQNGGPSFNVQGPATGRDSLILGAGFAVRWSDRVSTYVYYDGELGRTNYESNNVSGGFRVEF